MNKERETKEGRSWFHLIFLENEEVGSREGRGDCSCRIKVVQLEEGFAYIAEESYPLVPFVQVWGEEDDGEAEREDLIVSVDEPLYVWRCKLAFFGPTHVTELSGRNGREVELVTDAELSGYTDWRESEQLVQPKINVVGGRGRDDRLQFVQQFQLQIPSCLLIVLAYLLNE